MQQRFFIADLIACSTCFGHHYAHHQELRSIIQWLCVWFAGCCSILQTGHITLSSAPDQQLENHSTKYHRQRPLYNTPELLMMGVVVPETCWASNKICNKNLCCIWLAFYFHILMAMHRQNHIKPLFCYVVAALLYLSFCVSFLSLQPSVFCTFFPYALFWLSFCLCIVVGHI